MFLFWIFGAILLVAIAMAVLKFGPAINGLFSVIWAEEERPVIKRETMERLNELIVDGKVPEETAVVMAAAEEGKDGQELLALLNAIDVSALAGIFMTKGPNKIVRALNMIDVVSKIGMRPGRK